MKELSIEEMTSVRGDQTLAFDISRSFNGSNVAAIVSANNVAEALPSNLSSGGTVTQAAVAQAGNQAAWFLFLLSDPSPKTTHLLKRLASPESFF